MIAGRLETIHLFSAKSRIATGGVPYEPLICLFCFRRDDEPYFVSERSIMLSIGRQASRKNLRRFDALTLL